MRGEGTTAVYRSTAVLIWALAVWHSWLARGLFVDGSAALLYMMHDGGYALFYDSRQTLMAVTQTPAAIAISLGLTDTHLLSQLLSAGLFGVPTAYYHACLARSRHDPALLGAVILAIAVVFLPTSFFIMGEYNTILPAVLFVVLVVATASRPMVGDGLMLIVTALVLMRSYETMLAYGLLAAALIAWRLRLSAARDAGWWLHALAALLFIAAAGFSLQSLYGPHVEGHLRDTVLGTALFWTNLQFVLPFAALLIVAVGGLVMPRLLDRRALYFVPAILLVLLALTPLLWLGDGEMRPLPKAHYHTRMMAGLLLAAMMVAAWLYALQPSWAPRGLQALAGTDAGRRMMLFAFATLLAGLPADLQLSELWRRSVTAFQATIAQRPGLIAVEDTTFSRLPNAAFIENWSLSSESLVLRRSTRDGVIVPPQDFRHWQFFDARKPWITNVDRFRWEGGS